jgi:N-acyl-D-amino-acid deacylase
VFDVVLHGGWVVDGSGAPPTRADLAITGDRIAAIGRLDAAQAAARIDCTGRYLLPGFIDAHVHGDAMVFDPDVQLAALAQGVTTFIGGQDGLSFAPGSTATSRYATEYFGAVNGDWPGEPPSSIADMLAAYDGRSALNVGLLVPQGNLRFEAIGADDPPASAEAMAAMRKLLEQSLDEGAFGLSTGLDYLPGRFADATELAALCDVAARVGAPYVSHMRGYESAAAQGMAEVRAIAEASGVAVHVSHYHGPANMLAGLVDDMRHDGIDVTFDSYPYTSGSSILAMVVLPAAIQQGGAAATLQRLANAETRASLDREWFAARQDELARVRLSYVACDEFAWAEGLLLPDAAAQAGMSMASLVCEALVAAQLRVGSVFRQPPTNTDADVRALLRHEAHVGGSDGIFLGRFPHPRGWATFARFLGEHTRNLGDWTWAQAASHLAGHTARRFGLASRGLLRPGLMADVVVLDPATVADVATYENPRRPAVGVDRVYVNGRLAFVDGAVSSHSSGRGLRRGSS